MSQCSLIAHGLMDRVTKRINSEQCASFVGTSSVGYQNFKAKGAHRTPCKWCAMRILPG